MALVTWGQVSVETFLLKPLQDPGGKNPAGSRLQSVLTKGRCLLLGGFCSLPTLEYHSSHHQGGLPNLYQSAPQGLTAKAVSGIDSQLYSSYLVSREKVSF